MRRQHLYLFELATRKIEALTSGNYDELMPSWSPDGSSIAFVTKRGDDADRHSNFDIYIIEAKVGATARQLTDYEGGDADPDWNSPPEWSPDSKSIAYIRGSAKELIYYGVYQLAVIPAAGGKPRLLAPSLDRNMTKPRWSANWGFHLFPAGRQSRKHSLESLCERWAGGNIARRKARGCQL